MGGPLRDARPRIRKSLEVLEAGPKGPECQKDRVRFRAEGGLAGVTKAEVVNAERAKLTELFASVEESKRRLVAELIENAAFLAGELAEEREMLRQTGMVRVNPHDPSLQKPVEAAKQFRHNLAIYAVVIKALNGVLSRDKGGGDDDGLGEYDEE